MNHVKLKGYPPSSRIGQCIAVTCEDGSLYILHRTKLGVCDSRPSIQGTEAKRHVIFSPVSCCLLSLAQSILTVSRDREL